MANFHQHIAIAKQLKPETISRDLFKFIRSIEKQFLDKNKEQLFEKSQDIYGQAVGFYSYATEQITKGKKKQGEPFDAKDTGDLFTKMYMQEVSGVIRFGSKSPHYAEILKSKSWLSKDILGLTDESLSELIENELKPFIISYYRLKLRI
ncbi:hypothetical protein [Flavobacterium crassostreae]|uniref:Uncharacterized protein n=1 Tax=Flavobacterium crassostreae TaxID=1763534 RepID=A0A1B9E7R7_9FLAO|nr:hypothetical protein [Flavobacterium crassostreae]OCB77951.1 hypothetical protein LPBF_03115 [Flavobacterium crassostreae]